MIEEAGVATGGVESAELSAGGLEAADEHRATAGGWMVGQATGNGRRPEKGLTSIMSGAFVRFDGHTSSWLPLELDRASLTKRSSRFACLGWTVCCVVR